MTWTRSLLFFPPVVLGVALLALSISGREPPAATDRAEIAEPVLFVEATPRTYAPRVEGFGEVRPDRVWDAVAQVPGRVAELHPDFTRGGFIDKGELVARIEDADYRLAVAQARAEIETARLTVEERRLSRETTRRLLEIESEALALARRELERQQDLATRGTAAAASVEAQERAVLTQRARVQDLENRLELAPVQIEELQQTIEVRRARLRAAELDLARTELRAPFDARVAEVAVQQSQFAGAGASLGRLDGIGAAEVSAQVPPARMAGFARLAARGGATPPDREGLRASGLSAELRTVFQGVEASWEAEVRRISDVMDPETRSIGIIVSVPDPYGQVVPGQRPPLIKGMFVRVILTGPPVEDVILLPRASIREGRALVIGPENRLRLREVEIAYEDGDLAAIAAGLEPGARVVTSDLAPVIEGRLLAPERDKETEARLEAAAAPRDGDE